MPRDHRITRQYFAPAVIQEEDPEKLSRLMQQLHAALSETEEQPSPKPPRSGPLSISRTRRANRWRDDLMSRYAPAVERAKPLRPHRIWRRVLGLAITLVVSAGGWILAGFVISHFLR